MTKNRVRPFDTVKDIINAVGLDISYFYDDLIFSDHSLFIIRFNDNKTSVLELIFNRDCDDNVKTNLKEKLYREAADREMEIIDCGKFHLTEDPENKEITIHYEK